MQNNFWSVVRVDGASHSCSVLRFDGAILFGVW